MRVENESSEGKLRVKNENESSKGKMRVKIDKETCKFLRICNGLIKSESAFLEILSNEIFVIEA